MIKPTKVLCKRTLTSGDTYWWDNEATPPIRHERDNRMFVADNWYDVIPNDNDSWDEEKRDYNFTVIDNQGNPHLHIVYDEQDKANWPDICTRYGPRDYAKWFYTPEELILLDKGEFKLIEDINIKPGNYHWVKTKTGKLIIAQCTSKHAVQGKFYWNIMGTDLIKTCFDFAKIGEQVISQKEQIRERELAEAREELIGELIVLVDAINKNDPDENYPSVEYVMPFVNEAVDKYFDNSFENLSELFTNKD